MKKEPPGRRVNIYLPADLLERWDQVPRYERSAEVAAALRAHWQVRSEVRSQAEPSDEKPPKGKESNGA